MNVTTASVNADRIRLVVYLLRSVRFDLDAAAQDRIPVQTILDIERLGLDLEACP